MDNWAWAAAVISLISSTALTTIIGFIIKRALTKRIDQQEELLELKRAEEARKRKQELEEAIAKGIQPLYNKLNEMSVEISHNTTGTVTLMREGMKQARDYLVVQGYASASDVAAWHELYNTYAQLGGNHFRDYVDAWRDDVDNLPREHH